MTATPGCKDDSVVTSSISMLCAATPFASAAQDAVARASTPNCEERPPGEVRAT
jgi:hypothetical protein